MFARCASEKDRPEDDGRGEGGGAFIAVSPVIVIIAVTDFFTIFFFRKNVGASFLSNVSAPVSCVL